MSSWPRTYADCLTSGVGVITYPKQQAIKYPWAQGLNWKTLRNEYCRNKDTYDQKIANLSRGKSLNLSSVLLSSPVLDVNKPNPAPKTTDIYLASSGPGSGKKLLIEQPRKFAFDMTNLKRKGKTGASVGTVPQRRNLAENLMERGGTRKKVRLDVQTPGKRLAIQLY